MGTCQIETTSGCITQAGGEICNNEVDDDCNGLVDEGCTP
jgi:hypothetical protein